MEKPNFIKIIKNKFVQLFFIIILLVAVALTIFWNEWISIFSWLIFLIINLCWALNKFEQDVIECNKLKNIVLSDKATVRRFFIFGLLFILFILVHISIRLEFVIAISIFWLIVSNIISNIISVHYKRKVYFPFMF